MPTPMQPTPLFRDTTRDTTRPVLLINPRMCRPSSTRLPLSVLHLAAVLEGKHPWRILDGNLAPSSTPPCRRCASDRTRSSA